MWPQNGVLAFNEMETKLIFLLLVKTVRKGFSGDRRVSSTLTAQCCPARPVYATVLFLWQQKGHFYPLVRACNGLEPEEGEEQPLVIKSLCGSPAPGV